MIFEQKHHINFYFSHCTLHGIVFCFVCNVAHVTLFDNIYWSYLHALHQKMSIKFQNFE